MSSFPKRLVSLWIYQNVTNKSVPEITQVKMVHFLHGLHHVRLQFADMAVAFNRYVHAQ